MLCLHGGEHDVLMDSIKDNSFDILIEMVRHSFRITGGKPRSVHLYWAIPLVSGIYFYQNISFAQRKS